MKLLNTSLGCLLIFALCFCGSVFAGRAAKDCIFNGTFTGLDDNCTRISGSILFGGSDAINTLYAKLAYVEEVNGCIQVTGTSYTRLDFFARLRSVTCTNTTLSVDFMVSNNSALERLGMPVLRVNRLGLTFNPKLCITTEESSRYTNVQRGAADNFTACQGRAGVLKECSSTPNGVNGGLPDDCELITGNLYVDGASNANITTKLQYVKEVYGRVYIRSTTLSNLTIPLLEKVYASEPTASTTLDPTINVASNMNFTKLSVPKINFMAKNDLSFLTSDASYVMDQDLCNQLSPFGNVMSNGTVCGRSCQD
ncbi:Receptor L-domain domain-containing protein [Caenorhabditis elegans]|uniref:Receptor L-domain domain-containing protein n=1 Tax=Caenorhabditis elegans TaxID=6239 RepID=Q19110_CAEEL|nr:Receptor L-domain domain-containing protein [Caenorhabditis elegans]CAA91021.1 Receptor L-domain domain-containing protein [Caenorhabditis elegans]|eukprot:NP_510227.1 Insulin/EGF-Receptor L Domain protein [Caenorhabditis elegans]